MSSFGSNDAKLTLANTSEVQVEVEMAPIVAVERTAQSLFEPAVSSPTEELGSFGRNDAGGSPVVTSEEPVCAIPVPARVSAKPSKGVDKNGYPLELSRALRRRMLKEAILEQKAEKRRRIDPDRPLPLPIADMPIADTLRSGTTRL